MFSLTVRTALAYKSVPKKATFSAIKDLVESHCVRRQHFLDEVQKWKQLPGHMQIGSEEGSGK
jgi:hypothetical protein